MRLVGCFKVQKENELRASNSQLKVKVRDAKLLRLS